MPCRHYFAAMPLLIADYIRAPLRPCYAFIAAATPLFATPCHILPDIIFILLIRHYATPLPLPPLLPLADVSFSPYALPLSFHAISLLNIFR
jgi:hypothetical protein